MVGENGAEFTDIRRGDIIFNHKQTEDLLSKGYVSGRGKAYAYGTSGTAYAFVRESGAGKKAPTPTADKDLEKLRKETVVLKAVAAATNAAAAAAKKLTSSSSGGGSGAGANTFSGVSGTAGVGAGINTYNGGTTGGGNKTGGGSGSGSNKEDDAKEIFDWIEVRLEEINEAISLKNAQLENTIGSLNQNKIVDDLIGLNQKLYNNLIAGAEEYNKYSAELLKKVPEEYREAAQDGSIAIEEFVGEVDKETLESIKEYREWVQKGADATQKAEEALAEISALAKKAIDNIAAEYENKMSLKENRLELYEAYNALLETDVGSESANIYKAMMKTSNSNISMLEEQRDKMQSELNKRVQDGEIKKYSQDWYDVVNAIADVDLEIVELKTDVENFQDSINELHWNQFDHLITKLELVSSEAENLVDILSSKDLVSETGEWTKEGITSLGLYAQQMEAAEMQAKQYEEEIKYLNKNWKKLGYTEQEYVEKLEELKSGQYDAIQAYHDTKDAIVDLNKTRIDEIKNVIEKEIESYQKLIEEKKRALDAEKD